MLLFFATIELVDLGSRAGSAVENFRTVDQIWSHGNTSNGTGNKKHEAKIFELLAGKYDIHNLFH